MESTESPRGVYGESMRSFHGVHCGLPMESTIFQRVSLDSMWTPHGLHVDSTWSPCGLYVDCRKYSHGLPLKSMESSWSPWKPVGECKVLSYTLLVCMIYVLSLSSTKIFSVTHFPYNTLEQPFSLTL